MNISSIKKVFSMIPVQSPVRRNASTLLNNQECDFFVESSSLENYHKIRKIVDKVRKVTQKEYKKITSSQMEDFASNCIDKNIKKAADENVAVGLPLKKFLDEKYGNDKYVFVSIGASPAPIGRVMEFSGVETKYLPISGLREVSDSKQVVESLGFEDYVKFFKKQGVDRQNISKNDKTYVFYDYSFSGNSLNIFKNLMLDQFDLPKDKVDFRCLNDDILSLKKEIGQESFCNTDMLEELFIDDPSLARYYVRYFLELSHGSRLGGVGHLNYRNLSKITDTCRHEDNYAKFYNLMVMDKLSEMGLLKSNSRNKFSL